MLDDEQKQIFINFIDTFKEIIRDKRSKFIASHLADGYVLINHPFKPKIELKISKIDFEAIKWEGLFKGYYLDSPNHMEFIIPLEALEEYDILKNEKFAPIQRVENDTLNYLKSQYFQQKYPKAYKKWHRAESLFLEETSNANLTTIGHLCRESLQEFSNEVLLNKSISQTFSKANTIEKIKFLFNSTNIKSDTTKQFLDSLLNYWGCLSDLVQKQEHDSHREGGKLNLEDARRIIFHSAIVMFEIDKTMF